MKIRDEGSDDIVVIHDIHTAAFERDDEANIVDAIRTAGAVTLSLVAEVDGAVVGHLLISPVQIEGERDTTEAMGLGPMAVTPGHQRSGIGSALVRASLDRLREMGQKIVVVLGHPDFYPRFGFRQASSFGIEWEHDAPEEAFMVATLDHSPIGGGIVRYRPEFGGL